MVQLGVIFIKLPSQFFSNARMNEALDRYKGIVKWHSTGMHTTQEILDSVYFFGYGFAVTFYCRSMYPCPIEKVDLASAISLYAQLYDSAKGYSSHDVNGSAIPYFTALGCRWVERHYTLDKNMKGSDHGTVSSDFAEIRDIINGINTTLECMYSNKLDVEELKVRKMYITEG